MRITSNMMSSSLLNNLNRNAQKMTDTQLQMTTGMKINKPSDDPTGITYSLRYRQELSSNSQFQRNADSASSWLEFGDSMLTEVDSIMQRVRELTVNAANGTNPQEAHDSIRAEVMQLKEQLIDIGNSQLNGKYIFNGEVYDQKPYNFTKTDGSSDTSGVRSLVLDQGKVNYTVGAGVQMDINTSGNAVFGGDEDDNLFAIMNNLDKALADGDLTKISDQLGLIDSRTDKVSVVHAGIGAKSNRLELIQSRLGDLETNLTELQSKTEDADYAELLIKSKIEENVYNASLSVGAKIISTSLIDFMR
ncbi:flagellar hook-associated protein FlgL [Saccharibacillus sp. CPCC 101409]|uniref:flagellar hook-associated protein FlgL n=1 Tax=Saccharibacillus sp. CPCC 101409 TaxID=3058041 RepID=UPI002673831E|nr:flagellar hook-associated protein FlgL [Saccharibacillus sp. CPCC 101409]MDO3412083.1 flagellar hook-associated protein FlgL [Saccharibacillus sp. CPCC 101409]